MFLPAGIEWWLCSCRVLRGSSKGGPGYCLMGLLLTFLRKVSDRDSFAECSQSKTWDTWQCWAEPHYQFIFINKYLWMHVFLFSSSLPFEVWRGKDRPKCAEVGCDRPGAESPQAPSGPACLPSLLGNSRQVLTCLVWSVICYVKCFFFIWNQLTLLPNCFSFIRYMVKHKSHLRFWTHIRASVSQKPTNRILSFPALLGPPLFEVATFIQAAIPSSSSIPTRHENRKRDRWTFLLRISRPPDAVHWICCSRLCRGEEGIFCCNCLVGKQKYQNMFYIKRQDTLEMNQMRC